MQYKLTSKLARLLGIHTATRPDIINAVWQYIKVGRGTECQLLPPQEVCCSILLSSSLPSFFLSPPSPFLLPSLLPPSHPPSPLQSNRLQDPQEREYINNDKYFQQVKFNHVALYVSVLSNGTTLCCRHLLCLLVVP